MSQTSLNDRPVRFALVGCGRIAATHIEALGQHAESARWVDVCDTDPQALKSAVERTGAIGHATLDSLLAATTADIVVLCTPSGLHAAQTVAVARSGRHVLTEKPMATRWADGLAMARACREAGVRLLVVKQNRLNATLQLLRKAVERKRFGRIHMVAINVFWTRPQGYYDAAPWRGTRAMDGGAFMNQASHYVDLLDWLIGPVSKVHAFTGTLARAIECEDTGVLSVKWADGAMGSVNVTMLTFPRNLEGSITILGEKGSVQVGGVAVNEIRRWEFDQTDPDDELVRSASYETTSVYGFGHTAYYANVIRSLRGEDVPVTDGDSGLRSLEILCAAYESAELGCEVALPLPVASRGGNTSWTALDDKAAGVESQAGETS